MLTWVGFGWRPPFWVLPQPRPEVTPVQNGEAKDTNWSFIAGTFFAESIYLVMIYSFPFKNNQVIRRNLW